VHGVGGKLIKAITANQRKMVELMRKNDMVFAIGPAGTGKTYTGVALAVQALKNKEVKRIILTRKLDPYMQPLYDALRDMIAPEKLAHYIENGTIQIAPLAFMRGRTLDNVNGRSRANRFTTTHHFWIKRSPFNFEKCGRRWHDIFG